MDSTTLGGSARIKAPRRQLFAPYIRILNFGASRDPTLHTLFADLRFTRLRELTLENFPVDPLSQQRVGVLDGWNLTVSQYLQLTLEFLELLSCELLQATSGEMPPVESNFSFRDWHSSST
jgi:hypothetical protein